MAYAFQPPGAEDGDTADVSDALLFEIARTGADGVKGRRAVRALVRAGHKAVDGALSDLINNGLVDSVQVGRAKVYFVTDAGIDSVAG